MIEIEFVSMRNRMIIVRFDMLIWIEIEFFKNQYKDKFE